MTMPAAPGFEAGLDTVLHSSNLGPIPKLTPDCRVAEFTLSEANVLLAMTSPGGNRIMCHLREMLHWRLDQGREFGWT